MVQRLLRAIRSDIPVISTLDDLTDPRAHKLAVEHFLRITDLAAMYSELEKKGGKIEVEVGDLSRSEGPPPEYKELLAGAVLHYEITQRRNFKIEVDRETFDVLGGITVDNVLMAVIRRRRPVAVHEQMADMYLQTAQDIYNIFEQATAGNPLI